MNSDRRTISRRNFVAKSAAAAAAFSIVPRHCLARSGQVSPNEKIRIAGIGVGRQGGADLLHLEKTGQAAFVALCDVDEKRGAMSSDFSYGGPLSEIALLGDIALRLPGTELKWDSEAMRFTNSSQADAMLTPHLREGWEL